MKQRLAILGSTGSIGSQTLDVIRQHPDLLEAVLLTANNNVDLLISQALEFRPEAVVICNEAKYQTVKAALEGTPVRVLAGMDAVCDEVVSESIDTVVAAMVGFSGLKPTLAAIKAGKKIALANKETLVAAGAIVMEAAAGAGVKILPVDSEHSAIFQCLQGETGNTVRMIHLTASGGPFRTWPKERIAAALPSDALKHPNWNMGAKITIDSATMMNKGFEVIEARWLFDTPVEKIHVVVHPQSVIHSMVEFEDGTVKAQLGSPDMREPISVALAWPRRLALNTRKLDFAVIRELTFEEPDMEKFPALALAFEAIARGGNMPSALNAANEVAVAAFLNSRIGFYDIASLLEQSLAGTPFIAVPSLDDIFETDAECRRKAEEAVLKIAR